MRFHLYSPFVMLPTAVVKGMVKVDLDSALAQDVKQNVRE